MQLVYALMASPLGNRAQINQAPEVASSVWQAVMYVLQGMFVLGVAYGIWALYRAHKRRLPEDLEYIESELRRLEPMIGSNVRAAKLFFLAAGRKDKAREALELGDKSEAEKQSTRGLRVLGRLFWEVEDHSPVYNY